MTTNISYLCSVLMVIAILMRIEPFSDTAHEVNTFSYCSLVFGEDAP